MPRGVIEVFEQQTPRDLLDEQIEVVLERRDELLTDRIDEEKIYDAAERLESLESTTQMAVENGYGLLSVYGNLADFIYDVIEHQEFEEKVVYDQRGGQDVSNDTTINLLRWFKLYASVLLEDVVEFEHAWVLDDLTIQRNEQRHARTKESGVSKRQPDPVYVSKLTLTWRVIEDVLETWGELLNMRGVEKFSKRGELEGENQAHECGFIQKLDREESEYWIRSYNRGEEGLYCTFEPGDPSLNFFPHEGDLVEVVYPDNPRADNAERISRLEP